MRMQDVCEEIDVRSADHPVSQQRLAVHGEPIAVLVPARDEPVFHRRLACGNKLLHRGEVLREEGKLPIDIELAQSSVEVLFGEPALTEHRFEVFTRELHPDICPRVLRIGIVIVILSLIEEKGFAAVDLIHLALCGNDRSPAEQHKMPRMERRYPRHGAFRGWAMFIADFTDAEFIFFAEFIY